MTKKFRFTIGADPELFLKDSTGKFISSIGKIGGTKDKPAPVGKGCAVQEDNVAMEFNIPPAKSYKAFNDSIKYGMKILEAKAKKLKLDLAIEASAEFTPDQLNTPQALVFGCDPDFNIWTMNPNDRPSAENQALRSCGGHIHVGTDINMVDSVKAMDLFLGCPSTLLDKDDRRRQLYGKAGAHRPKPYGFEYRTLSNFWIKTDEMRKWAYEQTERALNWVVDHKGPMEWDRETSYLIQACINDNDREAYMALDKKYKFAA